MKDKKINNGDDIDDSNSFDNLPSYFNNGNDVIKIDSGGIFNFYHGDSLELYQKNLKIQPKDWRYRTKSVKYNLNSYGYRTKEFDEISWQDSIVVFGCSNVFGIGLAESETIPYYLSKLFDKNVVNMGIPASSNELMLYNSLMLKLKYGIPYCVIMVWSSFERSTYFTEGESLTHIGAWNYKEKKSDKKLYDFIYEDLQTHWTHSPIKTYYNVSCAREIWKNTKYYDCSLFYNTSQYAKADILPYFNIGARDLAHPDFKSMRLNAEFIYNKINGNKIEYFDFENYFLDVPEISEVLEIPEISEVVEPKKIKKLI